MMIDKPKKKKKEYQIIKKKIKEKPKSILEQIERKNNSKEI